MKEASRFQKNVIEQIEKIGDAIALIEGYCKNIEEVDPLLVSGVGDNFYSAQPITKFIINHRRYTIWYNEMRDFIFQELSGESYISENNL